MRVRETPTHYIIERNPHLKSAGVIGFKNIKIEFGQDESSKTMKIREVHYPKSEYKRGDLKRVYKVLADCEVCRVGKSLNSTDTTSQNTFKLEASRISSRSEKSMPSLTSWMDSVTKSSKGSTVYGTELLAQLLEIPVDLVATTLGAKVTKFLAGAALMIAANYGPKKQLSVRMRDEMNELASHLLFRFLDFSPTAFGEMKADFGRFKSALSFGKPKDALGALFRPLPQAMGFAGEAASGIKQAVADLTPAIVPAGLSKITGHLPVAVPGDISAQFGGLSQSVRTRIH